MSTKTETTTERASDALEQSVRELVGLARTWAGVGLSIGSQSLDAASKSLKATSTFLTELKSEIDETAEA